MSQLTPTVFNATIGGLAIGLSIAVNAILLGRITCISGILGGLLSFDQSWFWRVAFHLGMAMGAFMLKKNFPNIFVETLAQVFSWKFAIAGFLLSFGTCLGDGGFSGHALCGVPRQSTRSIVSVAIFSSTAFVVYWLTGGFMGVHSRTVSLEDIFMLQVEPLKQFFNGIKPVFIGLVGVIFVSVKGLNRSIPSLNVFLPLLVGAYAGYLFSMGIGLSGMLIPFKWFGLWNTTAWDPTLLFAFFPALLLSYSCFYLLRTENNRPILYSHHYLPTIKPVDGQLVIGAILFGLGLGWLGMTPETLLLQFLGNPRDESIRTTFIGMMVGLLLFSVYQKWLFQVRRKVTTKNNPTRRRE
ncbi:uncharacterized protein Gasu_29120 [Galdieria sulphuraria]|uniref:YeeE/YedE family protein n=1 Tax=Galdieria sulphuraria TaxID=130081 RepID=M2Y1K0_GALSU|nr:uncharacterized protein Gasu_29120 [Galdieria sulphuraria]EME29689.1 hypothetical protein Gasu_29120 [Galdieria sulphuraria]|eukprot:XP_005706209.1 hypothetical protein Gasu_29120 [Galdieria sulphuraria]